MHPLINREIAARSDQSASGTTAEQVLPGCRHAVRRAERLARLRSRSTVRLMASYGGGCRFPRTVAAHFTVNVGGFCKVSRATDYLAPRRQVGRRWSHDRPHSNSAQTQEAGTAAAAKCGRTGLCLVRSPPDSSAPRLRHLIVHADDSHCSTCSRSQRHEFQELLSYLVRSSPPLRDFTVCANLERTTADLERTAPDEVRCNDPWNSSQKLTPQCCSRITTLSVTSLPDWLLFGNAFS